MTSIILFLLSTRLPTPDNQELRYPFLCEDKYALSDAKGNLLTECKYLKIEEIKFNNTIYLAQIDKENWVLLRADGQEVEGTITTYKSNKEAQSQIAAFKEVKNNLK